MKAQFTNQLITSTLLWLDYTISKEGEGYVNGTGRLYRVRDDWNNYVTYALPYKQIVGDQAVTGANIMSGVYINSVYATVGVSGLTGINFAEGQAYFTGALPSSTVITGSFAVKDFNVKLTNRAEEELLFETKHSLKPKISQSLTGLTTEEHPFPVIYVKNNGGSNKEAAFGGEEETTTDIRLVILADNQWNLDAVTSLIKDKARAYIPLINENEMPFNAFGYYKNNSIFNYSNLTSGKVGTENAAFIQDVSVISLDRSSQTFGEIKKMNSEVFPCLIDITATMFRYPRSC